MLIIFNQNHNFEVMITQSQGLIISEISCCTEKDLVRSPQSSHFCWNIIITISLRYYEWLFRATFANHAERARLRVLFCFCFLFGLVFFWGWRKHCPWVQAPGSRGCCSNPGKCSPCIFTCIGLHTLLYPKLIVECTEKTVILMGGPLFI